MWARLRIAPKNIAQVLTFIYNQQKHFCISGIFLFQVFWNVQSYSDEDKDILLYSVIGVLAILLIVGVAVFICCKVL